MNDILDFYRQEAKRCLSKLPWLAKLQSVAMDNLSNKGFPTRHDEEWKYTHVDALLTNPFSQPKDIKATRYLSDLPKAKQIRIENGLISTEQVEGLPEGVQILPLSEALVQHANQIKPYLGQLLQQEHGFHFLNTAMIQCGVFIYIPKGVHVESPIALIHHQDHMNQAVHLRHLIITEAESQVTVIEEYSGKEDCCYLTNTVTEILLSPKSVLNHYKIQTESYAAYHFGHVAIQQLAESQFTSHVLSLGSALSRSDLSVFLQEEYAQCLLNGIYVPKNKQHMDHHTTVNHLVADCQSQQDYKGILTDKAHAVFNGKVVVAKNAQHSNAKQQNKNLLLSAQAEIDTKPQLEIFADDVLCSHGATVGQLDEEALFYLATRGIDKTQASHYLIHAFTEENLRLISNPNLAQYMTHLLTQQLG